MDCILSWEKQWSRVFIAISLDYPLTQVKMKSYAIENHLITVSVYDNECVGFQTWIGYADIKSAPAYFYVQRSDTTFSQTKIPIPFDVEKLNAGGAFSASSGKFTAPAKGKYFFSASGIPVFLPSSSSRQNLDIGLYLNGGLIGAAHSDEMNSVGTHETLSFQSTVELQKGDQIWLEIMGISPGASLFGNGYFHFCGFTLEEEISQSLT